MVNTPGWSLPSEVRFSSLIYLVISGLRYTSILMTQKYQSIIDLALQHPDMTTVQLQSATGLSASQIAVVLARQGIRKKKGIGGKWEQTGIPYDMDPPVLIRKKRGRKEDPDAISKHPLYSIYWGMRNRCENPKHDGYKNWGGRGISICERWLGEDGFYYFVEDMEPRPTNKTVSGKRYLYTLERRDNNLGYSKENCCWATWSEQAKNRRVLGKSHGTKLRREQGAEIRKLAAEGVSRKDLAERFNISQCTLSYIIRNIMWKDR